MSKAFASIGEGRGRRSGTEGKRVAGLKRSPAAGRRGRAQAPASRRGVRGNFRNRAGGVTALGRHRSRARRRRLLNVIAKDPRQCCARSRKPEFPGRIASRAGLKVSWWSESRLNSGGRMGLILKRRRLPGAISGSPHQECPMSENLSPSVLSLALPPLGCDKSAFDRANMADSPRRRLKLQRLHDTRAAGRGPRGNPPDFAAIVGSEWAGGRQHHGREAARGAVRQQQFRGGDDDESNPLYEFFRRFGIPGGPQGPQAPRRRCRASARASSSKRTA